MGTKSTLLSEESVYILAFNMSQIQVWKKTPSMAEAWVIYYLLP